MSSPETSARLHFEGDGWIAYTLPNRRFAVRIHVGYKPTPDRWVIDEVRFADFRVTARDLRDFPLGPVEVWVNQLAQQGLVDMIEGKTSDTVQFAVSGSPTLAWVPKLQDPGGHPKPDEFYRFIGEVYGKAAAVSTRPAAELAVVWEVPVTTVHRWVRVARSRGYLPAGEAGRRG
jgi:hypothetical protein